MRRSEVSLLLVRAWVEADPIFPMRPCQFYPLPLLPASLPPSSSPFSPSSCSTWHLWTPLHSLIMRRKILSSLLYAVSWCSFTSEGHKAADGKYIALLSSSLTFKVHAVQPSMSVIILWMCFFSICITSNGQAQSIQNDACWFLVTLKAFKMINSVI